MVRRVDWRGSGEACEPRSQVGSFLLSVIRRRILYRTVVLTDGVSVVDRYRARGRWIES